ncbi:glycosyltransferase [Brachybacterium sp. YJGR34]|uniref:glycosyltransferase n=1 Tax=Brachybacterium sp. YJGR34 TaxID=2059911 RepID=UPI000E0B05AC|nr:glycosyltransferase [Brachybacterium sp. YJGR34]
MPTMLFHAPYPLRGRDTGSGVRPAKMRDAFEDAGYDVVEVTGRGRERAAALHRLRRALRDGLELDFAYGENSTMPTLLTEPHHLPTHPVVDLSLLRLLRRHEVPTGMFYRDVYWRFPAYREDVGSLIAVGTTTLYTAELVAYRGLDRVYLPSEKMASFVPWIREEQVSALPPGGAIHDSRRDEHGELTLLYVGNVSEYYRMHHLFEAVTATDGVRLIFCTPEEAWSAVRDEYPQAETCADRIEIVHARGPELLPLFRRAHLCLLTVEPATYRDFAAPVKLFEYIGHGKPVIATSGTHAGDLVESLGAGRRVDYGAEAISGALAALRDDRTALRDLTDRVCTVREQQTWTARAEQVAADLSALSR